MTSPISPFFRLFLLRHANAAWPEPGGRDFDRALDRKGQADIRDVAIRAYAAGYQPDRIIASPARRCRETALAVVDVFGAAKVDFDEALYDQGPDAYRRLIERHVSEPALMIVGHNPMIEALAGQFAKEQPAELAFGYPTAGLLVLDFERPARLRPKAAAVVDMIAPL
ncbi:SixA phosphatase family protein [Rhizobium sp. G21]|uniref:SixA phosphatase family protein n=1 Tax=Rhizobium sp. G21 TaxID=2758439 RepID=UPI0016008932|nr:histidine phosphatase family protein [Rhizobium sp. G21]MBB1247561.1 histidine phosphatase family protein [Rhizobium sp. G21]